jgi:D-amino-acid dehydrogenase
VGRLRRATLSSALIIGAAQYSNLGLNLGHGPLGLTFACGTASLLACLMHGKAAPFALDGLPLN